MSSQDEMLHKSQANHNENMLTMIDKTDIKKKFLDWKYVTLYYSALHFGDAILARKGIDDVDDHNDRKKKYVSVLTKDEFKSYKKLESRSIIARYHPEKSSILTDTDFNDCYTKHFLRIKRSL